MSGGLMSGGRMSGGRLSGGLKSYAQHGYWDGTRTRKHPNYSQHYKVYMQLLDDYHIPAALYHSISLKQPYCVNSFWDRRYP